MDIRAARDALSNTASWTSSSTARYKTSIPIRASQKNRRTVKTKKSKVRMPPSKRPPPEKSMIKKKSDPALPPLYTRAFPRLSPSQLPDNAVDDDESEGMLPPTSIIAVLPIKLRPGSRGLASGNMRLPRRPKNLNYIVHD
ncbi:hypothetical protein MCOR17_011793 [Pyricularia oryzae]|nr:hypothetical protein MCOR17_011793 [Pyricularia oryzae]